MKTSQMRKALKFHPATKQVYGGVFPRNRIPRIPKHVRIAYVINTDPDNKPGKHWIAFFLTCNTVYYFDPYGIKPTGFKKILQSRKKKVYCGKRLQGMGRVCGHYCIYFILSMLTHHSLDIFGSDLQANDRIVQRFVQRHFPL